MDLAKKLNNIWIRRDLWFATELSIQEKVLIARISDLSTNEKGYCWAKNKELIEFFGVSTRRIQQIIAKLAQKGIIIIQQGVKNKQPERRLSVNETYKYLINPIASETEHEMKEGEVKRVFEGVQIPISLWLVKNLTLQEKVLLVEIKSLTQNKGYCWAGNKHFSGFFGLSEHQISIIISSLKNKGILAIKYKRAGKVVIERKIRVSKNYEKYWLGGKIRTVK